MTDTDLSRALIALGIDDLSFRALPLLPLVQVAWADGEVQPGEHDLILSLAQSQWKLEEEGLRLLRNWLAFPPSRAYLRKGAQALVALSMRQHPDMTLDDQVLVDVRRLSRDVAKAAGGLFGFGAISSEEASALDAIAKALDIPEGASWESVPHDLAADFSSEPRRMVTISTNTATLDVVAKGGVLKSELDFSFKLQIGRDPVVIGSDPDVTVAVEMDPDVASRHCELVERDRKFYVRDLGTETGTFVDGERVLERRLLGGERIRVGQVPFEFKLLRKIPSQLLNVENIT